MGDDARSEGSEVPVDPGAQEGIDYPPGSYVVKNKGHVWMMEQYGAFLGQQADFPENLQWVRDNLDQSFRVNQQTRLRELILEPDFLQAVFESDEEEMLGVKTKLVELFSQDIRQFLTSFGMGDLEQSVADGDEHVVRDRLESFLPECDLLDDHLEVVEPLVDLIVQQKRASQANWDEAIMPVKTAVEDKFKALGREPTPWAVEMYLQAEIDGRKELLRNPDRKFVEQYDFLVQDSADLRALLLKLKEYLHDDNSREKLVGLVSEDLVKAVGRQAAASMQGVITLEVGDQ